VRSRPISPKDGADDHPAHLLRRCGPTTTSSWRIIDFPAGWRVQRLKPCATQRSGKNTTGVTSIRGEWMPTWTVVITLNPPCCPAGGNTSDTHHRLVVMLNGSTYRVQIEQPRLQQPTAGCHGRRGPAVLRRRAPDGATGACVPSIPTARQRRPHLSTHRLHSHRPCRPIAPRRGRQHQPYVEVELTVVTARAATSCSSIPIRLPQPIIRAEM
jgi:hypothetical protein